MQIHPDTLFHGRYLMKELKGRGSFGEVWLARDQKLDMDVAVKVYIALDTRGVEEFKSEYKTAFGLNHPNLLHAHHFDICEDRPYLVMPYCQGSAMNLIGNVDEMTLWHFIHDVANGLSYLHEMEIVHHDIKPDNILIDENNRFLITDFGISVKFRSTLRRNSAREFTGNPTGGSMPYMAPELFSEQAEAVNASDIWAMGVTLYEMMVSELPFFGQGGAMQLNGAKIPDIAGDYSDALKKVVKQCLSQDAWDRPTAKQLLEWAQTAINGETPDVRLKSKSASNRKRKTGLFVALGGIVVAVGVVLGYSNYQKNETRKLEEKMEAEKCEINQYYSEMAFSCDSLISLGNEMNTMAFQQAKEKLAGLKVYEESHKDVLQRMVSDSLHTILDQKMEDAANLWAKAAKAQAAAGEMVKAIEFYQLSLGLYETPETRKEYDLLSQNENIEGFD